MKLRATLILGLAALLWVVSYIVAPHSTASGFLRAGAEAGMVGGLADWFAVTALFKRPMGLPIPHTALIPRKKDELAAGLGQFVTQNFLAPDTIRAQVRTAGVVRSTATWVTKDGVAKMLADRAVNLASAAIRSADATVLSRVATGAVRTYAKHSSVSAALGRLLEQTLVTKTHEPYVTQLLTSAAAAIETHKSSLAQQLKEMGDRSGFVIWLLSTTGRAEKILTQAVALLRSAADQPDHDVRTALDDLLEHLMHDLSEGGNAARQIDQAFMTLVDNETTEAWVRDQFSNWLTSLDRLLTDPDQTASADVASLITSFAQRVLADDALAQSLEGHLEDFAVVAVERHGDQFTQLIRTQVKRWSPKKTADQFELAVGRDLQFIRINGTVVGALAGLGIHTVSLLLT